MVIGTGVKGRYTNEFAEIAIRIAKVKENTRLVVILLLYGLTSTPVFLIFIVLFIKHFI